MTSVLQIFADAFLFLSSAVNENPFIDIEDKTEYDDKTMSVNGFSY